MQTVSLTSHLSLVLSSILFVPDTPHESRNQADIRRSSPQTGSLILGIRAARTLGS